MHEHTKDIEEAFVRHWSLLGRWPGAALVEEGGSLRFVLHSSELAVGPYQRAGFVERCSFTVYATAPLWSKPDHRKALATLCCKPVPRQELTPLM